VAPDFQVAKKIDHSDDFRFFLVPGQMLAQPHLAANLIRTARSRPALIASNVPHNLREALFLRGLRELKLAG
jgi:hypothetical protein